MISLRNISHTFLAIIAMSTTLFAHSTPIVISVVDDRLTVDRPTYPNLAASETFGLANGGSLLFTDTPGLDIQSSVAVDTILRLNVLPLALSDDPAITRNLWYWNAIDGVSVAPHDQALTAYSDILYQGTYGEITIGQNAISPGPLTIGPALEDLIGSHEHVLHFTLNNNPTALAGVYGVYATLSSPDYATSDPFWLFFSYNASVADIGAGASAIIAATQAVPEPGVWGLVGVAVVAGGIVSRTRRRTATS